MENKELIIQLIQQDLKYNQLITGLRKIGFDTDVHTLEIIEVVAQLMGIESGKISDKWTGTYVSFLDQAHHYKISVLSEELKPLAEKCYYLLEACKDIEVRTKP